MREDAGSYDVSVLDTPKFLSELAGLQLYAPQNRRIASFRRFDQQTPVGPSHGYMQYTFVQPDLLLEALLALCMNRWLDINGM